MDPKSLLNDSVLSIYEDSAKRLWVGTAQGLSQFDKHKGNFTSYKPVDQHPGPIANNCLDIKEDRNGALWILAGKGMLYLSTPQATLQRFTADDNNPDGLPTDILVNSLVDQSGALWLGTRGFGMLNLNEQRSQFEFIQKDGKTDGYPGGGTFSIVLLPTGNYLVRTVKELYETDAGFQKFTHIPIVKAQQQGIRQGKVFKDKDGIVWMGSQTEGLFRYDPKSGRVKQHKNDPNDSTSVSHNRVISAYEDRKGRLWVSTYGGGLCL